MQTALSHNYLVPFDASFKVSEARTAPPENAPDKKRAKKDLEGLIEELAELQRVLYASDQHAVLLIFQAMDAAGKDGTIRAVLSGVNPAGFQVFSFKQPSKEEHDHDFLWRTSKRLPERGRIGVFNRSYYEEVLVVRVHPEWLESQKLPPNLDRSQIWEQRFESIRDHEQHLARNGVLIIKFWLNVSREEQRQRFLDRVAEADKNWKFSPGDVEERQHWPAYMQAYDAALNATSRPWAPWYAIPADNKPFMRLQVAQILVDTLKQLQLTYPRLSAEEQQEMQDAAARLREQG